MVKQTEVLISYFSLYPFKLCRLHISAADAPPTPTALRPGTPTGVLLRSLHIL